MTTDKLTGNGRTHRQSLIYEKLHEIYDTRSFDNSDVWAGNIEVRQGEKLCERRPVRVFVDTTGAQPQPVLRIFVEIYIRGVTDSGPLDEKDLRAMLWTDTGSHGFVDEIGRHLPDPGTSFPMSLYRHPDGTPVIRGNNAVFVSPPIEIRRTGVFNFTILFSADGAPDSDSARQWVYINDIAHIKDGVIVAIPAHIKSCPSFMEICLRKYGAKLEDKKFVSGKISDVTADLENIPADVLYLLPFFEPGTGDVITGKDVRKGDLGSIYAVKDFFRIAPEIISQATNDQLAASAKDGLITRQDLEDLFGKERSAGLLTAESFAASLESNTINYEPLDDALLQLAGRAELRRLVNAAHKSGRKIIFDLVLMQTSRDSHLINDHREWYALDEDGVPKTHKIAWLDYSDVALFDLTFNKPLQNYLSSIAPYWMSRCGLDGVRIDASQTVDTIFLKQIKNRINEVDTDAIVLGETLCAFEEAVDVPADMIYSLFVDHHINIEHATPYYDLLELYHNTFSAGTVGVAYFENHDSKRASEHWRAQFADLLEDDSHLKEWSSIIKMQLAEHVKLHRKLPMLMTALKNLQCSLINTFSGTVDAVNFSCFLENGSDYAETIRTDFEQKNLLDFSKRSGLMKPLHNAYMNLHKLRHNLDIIGNGHVFYLRNNIAPMNEDRVFSLVRHLNGKHLLFMANLDPTQERTARYSFKDVRLDQKKKYELEMLFDTYNQLHLFPMKLPAKLSGRFLTEGLAEFKLMPLQTVVINFE